MTEREEPRSVWDLEKRNPWVTFQDLLTIDDLQRRGDAVDAILRWPGASLRTLVLARNEREQIEMDDWFWTRDIDAREAAYHAEHPGSEWDRRKAA